MDILEVSKKLYKSLDGDYGKLDGSGLYEGDFRSGVLSTSVIESLIDWFKDIKPLILEQERNDKINKLLK